jgi:hypothetical protein
MRLQEYQNQMFLEQSRSQQKTNDQICSKLDVIFNYMDGV